MKYIYINWKDRLNQDSDTSEITINFNNQIYIKNEINLLWFTGTKWIYLINEYNNKIKITFSDNTIKNIEIPNNKNYDVDTLATYIKNTVNYAWFNMVFDYDKYIYTLSATQNFTLDLTQSEFYLLLNMKKEIYNSNNNILYWNVVNFLDPLYIFVDIAEIQWTLTASNNINSNFCIGPINSERFGLFWYQYKDYEQSTPVYNKEIKKLTIRLYDWNGRLLNMNKCNWWMILSYE